MLGLGLKKMDPLIQTARHGGRKGFLFGEAVLIAPPLCFLNMNEAKKTLESLARVSRWPSTPIVIEKCMWFAIQRIVKGLKPSPWCDYERTY